MIGYLKGQVVTNDEKKTIVLTSSGVGYEVNYGRFANPGDKIELYIHHHVSENDESLWGFDTLAEKKMFELLKTVNKVGSSKAYPLVSQIGVPGLVTAITLDQAEVLSQAPGIGKKMSEQIILSLRDKLEKAGFSAEQTPGQKSSVATAGPKGDPKLFKEALQALESLGYSEKQVIGALTERMTDSVSTSEELIKLVLRDL